MRADRGHGLRFACYAAVGAVGTLAHYAVLLLAVSRGWLAPPAASVAGALLGAAINYLLNARYTFGGGNHRAALPRFAATALLGAALNGLLMAALVDGAGLDYRVAQLLATCAVLGLTYAVNLLWTFKPPAAAGR